MKKPGKVWWSPQMDRVLIDALYDQYLAGEKSDRTSSPRAYDNIVTIVSSKSGVNIDNNHVKNQIKTLKANFFEAYDVFKHRSGGFSWDPVTCTMDATEEVWDALVTANPNTAAFKGKPIPFFESLSNIYAKDRAKGDSCYTAKETKKELVKESQSVNSEDLPNTEPITIEDIDAAVSNNDVILESFEDITGGSMHLKARSSAAISGKRKHHVPTSVNTIDDMTLNPSKTSKKLRANDILLQNCEIMKEGLQKLTDAFKEGNELLRKCKATTYSKSEIWQELVTLKFDEESQFDAYEVLGKDATLTECFFGLPSDKRKAWLMRKM